ncbi:MAG: protoporphyrinogen oxidase [Acidimicrobiales bacterium]
MTRPSVVVVGAGISGLAAAWELSGGESGPNDRTPRIELIEHGDQVGGALATTTFAGRTIDLGADGFLARRPEALTLVAELGWRDHLEDIAVNGSSIWLRGALHELPAGMILGVPTSSRMVRTIKGLSWHARVDARRDELFARRMSVGEDISIGEILRTKLGPELAYTFIEPMVGGIQAGRIDALSAKSVFPPLLEAARRGGSLMKSLRKVVPEPTSEPGPLFCSLSGGVGSLARELGERLSSRGVVVRTGVEVTALRRTPAASYPWEVDTASTTTPANALIVTTPARVCARLLEHLDPAFGALTSIDTAAAAMITFSVGVGDVSLPEHGTGLLVPLGTLWSGEGSMMVTAVTLLDRKWPRLRRDGDVLLRAHVGRSDDLRWMALSDEELVTRVSAELDVLLSRFSTPKASLVQRWLPGLPQYYVGHDKVVAQARSAATSLSLSLAGNSYDGVGVPASIGSGRAAAAATLEALATS